MGPSPGAREGLVRLSSRATIKGYSRVPLGLILSQGILGYTEPKEPGHLNANGNSALSSTKKRTVFFSGALLEKPCRFIISLTLGEIILVYHVPLLSPTPALALTQP